MTRTTDQLEMEKRLLAALEALTRNDVAPWPDLFSPDGVQEFPYAPQGSPTRIEGRQNIAAYLANYPEVFNLTRIVDPIFHHDAKRMVVEFSVEGRAVQTGRPYNQRYISVIEHEAGKIRRYVDYWNPLVVQEALGQMFK
jgi:uncharacterized protein